VYGGCEIFLSYSLVNVTRSMHMIILSFVLSQAARQSTSRMGGRGDAPACCHHPANQLMYVPVNERGIEIHGLDSRHSGIFLTA
jgi:hypothetical protein